MRNLLVAASVSDTLLSNHADATTFKLITALNYARYGPAGTRLFAHLASVLGTDVTKYTMFARVCLPQYPILPETLQLVYDVILASQTGDTYTFTSFEDTDDLTAPTKVSLSPRAPSARSRRVDLPPSAIHAGLHASRDVPDLSRDKRVAAVRQR